MELFILISLSPVLLGVVAARGWWLVRRRHEPALPGALAISAVVAGALGALVDVVIRLYGVLPTLFGLPEWVRWAYTDFRFLVPLVVGALGVVLLAVPGRRRKPTGEADLVPRGLFSFARGGWATGAAVVSAVILAVTVVAGLASEPDSTGRYTHYQIELGRDTAMGTTIYGWFYSLPALAAMAVLLVLTVAGVRLIARPALDKDRDDDTRLRVLRTRNVLAVATGALLLHLSLVLESLAGTASLRGTVPTHMGNTNFWTPIASLAPWLGATAFACAALGVAALVRVALSGVPGRDGGAGAEQP